MYHEKSIQIIETLNLSAKQVSNIIQKAVRTVYSKKKKEKRNCFTQADYEKLKQYALPQQGEINKMITNL